MELKDIKRREDVKNIRMSIRTTKIKSDYMKKKKISPQLFFDKALEEFMELEEER
tara:strand:- start:2945 stop:3109 length:165 start_codon:yes stop_codon:yes gene_type:complete